MNRATFVVFVLATLLALAGCTSERLMRYDRGRLSKADTLSMMTKQDIVSLSKAGVGDSLIVRMLDISGSYVPLRTQDVIELKNAGVSERVINAMMNQPEAPDAVAESAGGGSLYYPAYYWYSPYYSFWNPWYYSSFYFGFGQRYSRPVYVRPYVLPRHYTVGRFGTSGGGRWGGGGGHRR
jgi:hypothetical protein